MIDERVLLDAIEKKHRRDGTEIVSYYEIETFIKNFSSENQNQKGRFVEIEGVSGKNYILSRDSVESIWTVESIDFITSKIVFGDRPPMIIDANISKVAKALKNAFGDN